MNSGDGAPWRLGHRLGLDGLRGIAVLLVLAAHFGIPRLNSTSAGSAGVTAFFTLSGFLITTLLLEEHARTGHVRRGAFYLRRARRLVPAMLACVVLALVLELATMGAVRDWDIVIGSLTYTSNFAMMDGRWGGPTFLGNMWSLGIEEQFYLVWPLAVLALVRVSKTRALTVLLYASFVPVVLRQLMWSDGTGKVRLWMGFDTRADALLIGCLLAFWMHGRTFDRMPSRWFGIVGGLVLLSIIPWRLTQSPAATAIQMPLEVALATAALIYSCVTRPEHPILASRVLRYVGSRSYGWYLYQAPIQTALVVTAGKSMGTAWLCAFPATVALAELSWRYLEQPFRQASGYALNPELGGVGASGRRLRRPRRLIGEGFDIVAVGEDESSGRPQQDVSCCKAESV